MSTGQPDHMQENLEFALGLADQILSSGNDPHDAVLKAVGALAQVIYITTRDEFREETVGAVTDMIRDYLKVLDEVAAAGSSAH